MTDTSSSPYGRATDDPTPIAADPAAGTDAATDENFDIVRTADDVGAIMNQQETPDAARQRWANLNHPFAVGFTITLGGLSAALLLLTDLEHLDHRDLRRLRPLRRPRASTRSSSSSSDTASSARGAS